MLCTVTSIETCNLNYNLASGKVKATLLIGHWFNSVLKRPFLTKIIPRAKSLTTEENYLGK